MSNPESLDLLLSECTKSTDSALDAASVERFCTAINNDLDGPVTAARLLGHKIQSPQQQESLNALCVTDECVKKCGGRFQSEIGKFRFLNEMIKMISPKYFGDKTSAKVKDKCIELLYKWSLDLRHEPKILDAYEMLKRQGIIDEDPILGGAGATNGDVAMEAYPAANEMSGATSEQTDQSIFDDEDKSKLLAKLLRSKHPDDLQAANTLIKNMVKQDEEKQEKISQRYNLLETVRNNVKLLSEMLDCYQMAGGSSNSDKDIIKELYKNIDKERPKLFRLASETEDKDSDGMSQILQVNDDVVTVSQRYKQVIDGGEEKASEKKPEANALSEDLAGLDLGPTSTNSSEVFSAFEEAPAPTTQASDILALFSAPAVAAPLSQPTQFPPSTLLNPAPTFSPFNTASPVQANLSHAKPSAPVAPVAPTAPAVTSNLDDIFSFNSPATSNTSTTPAEPSKTISAQNTDQNADDIGLLSLDSSVTPGLAAPLLPVNDSPSLFDLEGKTEENLFDGSNNKKSALEDLDFLGQDLLQKTKPAQQAVATPIPSATPPVKQSLNQLKATNVEKTLTSAASVPQQPQPVAPVSVQPLTNIHVPLNSVKPGDLPPLAVYDKNTVKLVVHFAQNKPRDDVNVMVISITSHKNTPIKSVIFQAAVPKTMKVKLQPPSATELPAYNPILPPSAITQVMLLANPQNEKVKLKYKLSYLADGEQVADTGDILNIPM